MTNCRSIHTLLELVIVHNWIRYEMVVIQKIFELQAFTPRYLRYLTIHNQLGHLIAARIVGQVLKTLP